LALAHSQRLLRVLGIDIKEHDVGLVAVAVLEQRVLRLALLILSVRDLRPFATIFALYVLDLLIVPVHVSKWDPHRVIKGIVDAKVIRSSQFIILFLGHRAVHLRAVLAQGIQGLLLVECLVEVRRLTHSRRERKLLLLLRLGD